MMTTRADTFVFRLTSLCDKRCMLCCNNYNEIKRIGTTSFEDLLIRFSEIRDYFILAAAGDPDQGGPYFFLTGGEALLYRSRRAGVAVTLFDVIAAIRSAISRARVIVKTGGFQPATKFQAGLFDQIART